MEASRCRDEPTSCPPSYAEAVGRSEELTRVFDAVLETETRSAIFYDAPSHATERLTNFLRFVLTVDYHAALEEVGHQVKECDATRCHLAASDVHYFIRAAAFIAHYWRTNQNDPISGDLSEDDVVTCAEYWEYILAPARSLGLPTTYVFTTIWQFSKEMDARGAYKGTLLRVFGTQGTLALANRLWVDRNIVIPRIYRGNDAFAGALSRLVDQVQAVYFVQLEGREMKVAKPEAESAESKWCHVSWEKVVPTPFTQQQERDDRMILSCMDSGGDQGCGVEAVEGEIDPPDFFCSIARPTLSLESMCAPSLQRICRTTTTK
ncbi:hypothetical protein MPH_11889 [Macrophomina phaseolina MS6]|uniref:Uncharacterized protein n=1 Tax=Macrophomina phaseolina (strain MS6) TaxID=1126212 RepID=K2RD70_MACPH|nr:hypothetical protein MPH_11889 [Macrophomina phaseolina MS6]